MDILKSITIRLSEADVKAIIKEYVERQGYKVKDEVRLRVGSHLVGYGIGEHPEEYFESATVDVEKEDCHITVLDLPVEVK